MSPPGIIEVLDVIKHAGFGLVSRAVQFGRREFGLERGEEALHRSIAPDIASSAHATGHTVVGQEPLKGLIGVLEPPIGVMQDGLRLASPQIVITNELHRRQIPNDVVCPLLIIFSAPGLNHDLGLRSETSACSSTHLETYRCSFQINAFWTGFPGWMKCSIIPC